MVDGEETMAVTLKRRRFTLDEYHRMGETGMVRERIDLRLASGAENSPREREEIG